MSAAARARRLDEHASIVVLEQSDHVSFAGCGLPYQVSGEIAHRDTLLLHSPGSLRASLDLDVRTRHRVTAIDRTARTVTVAAEDGTSELAYDALSDLHGGWENNDGAYGEFVFDTAKRSISLAYYERYTATEDYDHEL